MSKRTDALEKLRATDFSQQAYRGYLIRTNALSDTMWVEKDGQLICNVPTDKSWVWARAQIDELVWGAS